MCLCCVCVSQRFCHGFSLLQARALTAHTAETEAVQFFVGTQSLRCENQVCCKFELDAVQGRMKSVGDFCDTS
jgi:hypothetical protein